MQFAAERVGARYLIIGWPAVVSGDVSVEFADQFADAFFAGDHSAFFGGDNLRAQRVTVAGKLLQLFAQRIFLGQFGCTSVGGVAHAFDGLDSPRHVLEQVVDFHGEIEFGFAVSECVGGARVHHDIELLGVGLISFAELDRVNAGQHARATLCSIQRRRGGGNLRRF